MNKYQEALNNLRKTAMNLTDLKHHSFPIQLMYRLDDDSKLIQELVDKEKPKKRIKKNLGEYICRFDYECPVCAEHLRKSDKYCSECGNAMERSENNE